ncbi:MAG: hypothetical protein FJW30_08195 [Acidobacteria bacterium]|nr:hypothetical protein [Acidobacteriota bacterium]
MSVTNAGKTAQITDLDKDAFIDINYEKREYSVTTFAEMKAFSEKAFKDLKTTGDVEVDARETGKTETIDGLKTKEYLLTMKMTAQNPQTGKAGEMVIVISSWLAPALPGHKEVQDFHLKMGQKLAQAGFGAGMAAGIGRGMAEGAKKLATIEGIPVLQIVRMMPTDPEQIKQMEAANEQAKQQQAAQANSPTVKEAAGDAATREVAGRLGRVGSLPGGLGGFGGLRRKKAESAPPPPPPPAAEAPAAPTGPQPSFDGEASLMEMTAKQSNFSNSPVDDSVFETPAGFKLVKSPMQK